MFQNYFTNLVSEFRWHSHLRIEKTDDESAAGILMNLRETDLTFFSHMWFQISHRYIGRSLLKGREMTNCPRK